MVVAAVISFGVPIGALVVARRRLHVQFRVVLVGALVFVVFAGFLEQLVHALAFSAFPGLRFTPVAFVPYAALAAGVFEELGRSCGFMLLLRSGKADHDLPCAIGYGVGHGGIEAMLIVGLWPVGRYGPVVPLGSIGFACPASSSWAYWRSRPPSSSPISAGRRRARRPWSCGCVEPECAFP